MKLIADENVAGGLVRRLRESGYDVWWILEDAPSSTDPSVLERATESGRTLLTFDSDFGTLAVRDDIAAPFGIIFPRLKRMTIAEQTDRVHGIIVTMDAIGSTLVVIEETKVRYRDLRLKD